MAGPLTWILELYDRVSGPAEKMSKATERFEHSMKKAGDATEKMAKAQKELSAERIAVMTEAVRLASEAIDELITKFFEVGEEILNTSDYAKRTQLLFKEITGGSDGGKEMFETAEEYADKAGLKFKDVVATFQALTSSGMIATTRDNLSAFAQLSGDIAFKTGQSTTAVAGLFSNIAGFNKLDPRQLKELTKLGIPVEILGRHLGVSANNIDDLSAALADKLPSGQKALQAIAASWAEMHGGLVGGGIKSLADGTIEGHANRFADAMERAFSSFSNTEGFARVLALIDKLTDRVKDPEFVKAVSNFASALVRAAEAMERMIPSATAINGIFGGGESYSATKARLEKENPAKGGFLGLFTHHEVQVQGYSDGWSESGKQNAIDQNKGFAEGIEAHSPSKVYERFGKYAADGFNIGFSSNTDDLAGTPSSTPAPRAGSNSAAGGGRVNVHQEFNISAAAGVDIEDLAQRISAMSATALESPLESLAISMGTM